MKHQDLCQNPYTTDCLYTEQGGQATCHDDLEYLSKFYSYIPEELDYSDHDQYYDFLERERWCQDSSEALPFCLNHLKDLKRVFALEMKKQLIKSELDAVLNGEIESENNPEGGLSSIVDLWDALKSSGLNLPDANWTLASLRREYKDLNPKSLSEAAKFSFLAGFVIFAVTALVVKTEPVDAKSAAEIAVYIESALSAIFALATNVYPQLMRNHKVKKSTARQLQELETLQAISPEIREKMEVLLDALRQFHQLRLKAKGSEENIEALNRYLPLIQNQLEGLDAEIAMSEEQKRGLDPIAQEIGMFGARLEAQYDSSDDLAALKAMYTRSEVSSPVIVSNTSGDNCSQ